MTTPSAAPRCLRFDRFTVDAGRRLLLRDGIAVPLTSKAFDVLLALVEGRGELVTKHDLLARVWPNQIVEEGNLTVHISAIRKALGERRGEHRYVVTVPGWGYRFVADLRDADDDPAVVATAAAPTPPAPPAPAAAPLPTRRLRRAIVAAIAVVVIAAVVVQGARTLGAHEGDAAPRGMSARLLTALGDVSSAVLSPDGVWFAYVHPQDGMESLWIRRVRGTEPPVQLRAPEDVDYRGLAFSPDGERLYFATREALFDIPVRGGAPRKALDGVRGPFSLSRDGSRVAFVRHDAARDASLLVVAELRGANAGREREVAALAAPRAFAVYGPAWSPDGASLAVGATSATAPGKVTLARVRIADGAVSSLADHAWDEISRVAWLPDGSGVLFHAVGAGSDFHIWLLDVATGAVRCVTPDLSRYGRASLSVTDDGASLLAVRSVVSSTIWVSPSADLAGARPITSRAFGKLDGSAGLTWTRDGRIVYVSFVNGTYSLWSMTADGRDARPLTSSGYMDRFPQATADGRALVFESNRGGGEDVWRVDGDGSHLRALTTGGHAAQPTLTPDGRWVLYTRVDDGAPSVWRLPVDGGASQRVTGAGASWPSVSPDGTRLAVALSDSAGRETRLAVLSLADGRRVAEFPLPRGGRLSNGVHWVPDGSALIYRDFDRGLWRQPLTGGAAARVGQIADGRIYFLDWAKDGRRAALSYVDEVRDVVLMTGFR
ncbi:transcriptional regulator domain-containing protein (plasmid) [Gemmatirosa kalamazoonensis]|uniref:Transcriptional regulator domain-containing protein n=1 Tax=Gemmatirosa kalamazoonensis TaxID=861299 RepID=W0RT78_9BACT|nr:winged helix-turn-helix domain-containing protein [Gemmatirosa kalamazoonensis]AHG93530.1 transcriptional regulator domain-containing protein [Gemmatirosa kalamazoonensis]